MAARLWYTVLGALKRELRQFLRFSKPFWELGFGGVLAVFLAEAARHLQWIATNVTGTTGMIIILAACFGLYLVRHFSRLAYGTLEIVVGMYVIIGTMSRGPELVDPDLLLVQLAAGMYVIIRGFDNFAQSAPFVGGAAMRQLNPSFVPRRVSSNPRVL